MSDEVKCEVNCELICELLRVSVLCRCVVMWSVCGVMMLVLTFLSLFSFRSVLCKDRVGVVVDCCIRLIY